MLLLGLAGRNKHRLGLPELPDGGLLAGGELHRLGVGLQPLPPVQQIRALFEPERVPEL